MSASAASLQGPDIHVYQLPVKQPRVINFSFSTLLFVASEFSALDGIGIAGGGYGVKGEHEKGLVAPHWKFGLDIQGWRLYFQIHRVERIRLLGEFCLRAVEFAVPSLWIGVCIEIIAYFSFSLPVVHFVPSRLSRALYCAFLFFRLPGACLQCRCSFRFLPDSPCSHPPRT